MDDARSRYYDGDDLATIARRHRVPLRELREKAAREHWEAARLAVARERLALEEGGVAAARRVALREAGARARPQGFQVDASRDPRGRGGGASEHGRARLRVRDGRGRARPPRTRLRLTGRPWRSSILASRNLRVERMSAKQGGNGKRRAGRPPSGHVKAMVSLREDQLERLRAKAFELAARERRARPDVSALVRDALDVWFASARR
jgi:hypothetical protein